MSDWQFLPAHEREAALKASAARNPAIGAHTVVQTVTVGGKQAVVSPHPPKGALWVPCVSGC